MTLQVSESDSEGLISKSSLKFEAAIMRGILRLGVGVFAPQSCLSFLLGGVRGGRGISFKSMREGGRRREGSRRRGTGGVSSMRGGGVTA